MPALALAMVRDTEDGEIPYIPAILDLHLFLRESYISVMMSGRSKIRRKTEEQLRTPNLALLGVKIAGNGILGVQNFTKEFLRKLLQKNLYKIHKIVRYKRQKLLKRT